MDDGVKLAVIWSFCIMVVVGMIGALIYFGTLRSSAQYAEQYRQCLDIGGSWLPITNREPMCLNVKGGK